MDQIIPATTLLGSATSVVSTAMEEKDVSIVYVKKRLVTWTDHKPKT